MKFETLKEFHLCLIQITLHTGEVHQGMITSHSFKNSKMEDIATISLMDDRSIVTIDCNKILSIEMLEKRRIVS